MKTYDAVIIGAGMSGFTAGIRLAMFDQKVCIFERHSVWGGLNSFYKKDGRQFDVGLHAMTNFVKPGTKKGPLPTVARQLRLKIDQFQLLEQQHSLISFPTKRMTFTNEIDVLKQEIFQNFPDEVDGFQSLCKGVEDHDDGNLEQSPAMARDVMGQWIKSELLKDMILCPLLFYGSAQQGDMDWNQFVIMFKSIFFEGFARPHNGVRVILSLLRKTYLERGGELKMKTGVQSLKSTSEGVMVELENGETILAKKVLSSAGAVETLGLLGRKTAETEHGQMTFVETIFCLDQKPKDLDIQSAIVFFNKTERFNYRKSSNLVDLDSGIICSPNNFKDETPLKEGMLRVTNIANYDRWLSQKERGENAYLEAKEETIQNQITALQGIIPEFKSHIVAIDSFTPLTINYYTSHINGAVYGSPLKKLDGSVGEKNVFLCGTDQGYLGIVGSMLSGILMANRHALRN